MKYIFYVSILFFTSCESFRVSKNQEYKESVEHPYKFNFVNNQIHCDVYSDSIKYDFMFDTGASRTMIFNDSIKQKSKLYGKSSSVTLAYGNTVKQLKATKDLDYQFLNVKNKEVLLGSFPQSTKCDGVIFDGIIGGDLLNFYFTDTTKYIFNLNFSDSTITIFDTITSIENFKDFDTIKSRFAVSTFSIFLKLGNNEKPVKCLFDTGFDYSLIIDDKKIYDDIYQKDSLFSLQKLIFLETPNGNILKEKEAKIDCFKSTISLNQFSVNEGVIHSNLFSGNIVGIQFIKNFDWIIDFKHKQVYFKPNNIEHDLQNIYSLMYKLDYTLDVKDDRLYINQVNEKFTKYKLGTIIKSVNGIEVTSENICELKNQVYADLENVKLEFDGSFLEEEK